MRVPAEHTPPPASTDGKAWRQAIRDGRYTKYRLEHIVAAIQDLDRCSDHEVVNTLAQHLSEALFRILRKHVGRHHPDHGREIIEATHDRVIDAVLQPSTADGKALRVAFIPRVAFRIKNVIASHARIPKTQARPHPRTSSNVEREGGSRHDAPDPSMIIEQTLDVETVLSSVTSEVGKRFAFRLYMDDIPLTSRSSHSITASLDICETTARKWVNEIRDRLANVPAVQDMIS